MLANKITGIILVLTGLWIAFSPVDSCMIRKNVLIPLFSCDEFVARAVGFLFAILGLMFYMK